MNLGTEEQVDELQKKNRLLNNEKNMFLTLLESTHAPVIYLDMDGKIRYLNSRAPLLFGDAIHPSGGYYDEIKEEIKIPEWLTVNLKKLSKSKDNELTLEHHFVLDDQQQYFLIQIGKMKDVSGKFTGYSLFAKDISALRKSQALLDQANARITKANEDLTRERDRIQNYLELVEAIIVALDADGNITMLNRKGCEVLGVKEKNILGKNWFHTCLPGDAEAQKLTQMFKAMVKGDLAISEYYENGIITKAGEIRKIAWHNNFIRDASGHVIGSVSAGEDITERSENLARLQEALDDRKKFFSILSHDLRGPMGAMVGLLELVYADYDQIDPGELKSLLKGVYETASNTQRLILTLLDWARVTEGRMKADKSQFPVQKLIRESVMDCQDMAEAKGVEIQQNVPLSLVVEGDYYMLNTALRNLISNAIKYSNTGSMIQVIGSDEKGCLNLSVRDHGAGMGEETKATLFQPARVKKHLGTAGEKGTGLGLSLSYEFVKLHDGDIKVDSATGKGSSFTIVLPC